jgi:bacteriorhodopsin
MQLKWYFTLVFITILFIISSFFIAEPLVLGYRWMTIGISIVAFIYCYIVTTASKKDSKKMMGGNLAAIVLKFILSSVVIIIYILLFGMRNQLDFAFFF